MDWAVLIGGTAPFIARKPLIELATSEDNELASLEWSILCRSILCKTP